MPGEPIEHFDFSLGTALLPISPGYNCGFLKRQGGRHVHPAGFSEMSDLEIERTMLAMPFEKFERKSFFRRLKDLAYVRFAESLWLRG